LKLLTDEDEILLSQSMAEYCHQPMFRKMRLPAPIMQLVILIAKTTCIKHHKLQRQARQITKTQCKMLFLKTSYTRV